MTPVTAQGAEASVLLGGLGWRGRPAWGCLRPGLRSGGPGGRLATGRGRGCAQGLLAWGPGSGIEVRHTQGHRRRPFTALCGVTAVTATSRKCGGREPGPGRASDVVGRAGPGLTGTSAPARCGTRRGPLRRQAGDRSASRPLPLPALDLVSRDGGLPSPSAVTSACHALEVVLSEPLSWAGAGGRDGCLFCVFCFCQGWACTGLEDPAPRGQGVLWRRTGHPFSV